MFLRAPPDHQPFTGTALLEWARAHHWVPYDPRGTITDVPGAGVYAPWMGIPTWPEPETNPTAFLPYLTPSFSREIWSNGWRGLGQGPLGQVGPAVELAQALPGLLERQIVPIVGREVELIAGRTIKKVFRDYVIPPLAGVGLVAGIALLVAISAYRRERNPRRRRNCCANGRRRNRRRSR